MLVNAGRIKSISCSGLSALENDRMVIMLRGENGGFAYDDDILSTGSHTL